ncbi:molybdopterin-dependent oxidoreductase [Corallococcus sp. c25j21]|nr:molybdopterin-dependent oxidoreductase [Corallococcus silvisoli]
MAGHHLRVSPPGGALRSLRVHHAPPSCLPVDGPLLSRAPAVGEVRVCREVGAFGVGTVLNAKTARSQLLGGIVMGIGMGLMEETQLDSRSARFITQEPADDHVPVSPDVPDIDAIFVPERDPHVNAVGAKGLGEIGITGTAAAPANAIHHATGRRIRELPLTLDNVLATSFSPP